MKLVVGLGNPGEKYVGTRHNLGFVVVEELVKKLAVRSGKLDIEVGGWRLDKKLKSYVLRYAQNDKALLLIKPQTYMNNSGMAVKLVADYFKVAPEDIIVVHDDLDLMLGKIKIRLGGAAAGHHGVESIIDALGTDRFFRVRLGIGNQRSHLGEHKRVSFQAEHFVLEKFLPNEGSQVKKMVKQAVEAIQNQYN